jgi:hypothetical protein
VMRKGDDGTPVNDVVFDVADSSDPVMELDRLFRIHNVSLDLAKVGQLRRAGKIDEAIALGEAALGRLPEGHRRQPYESVNTALALLYYTRGDHDRARGYLKAGADALPIHRRLLEQRARTDETARKILQDTSFLQSVYGR